MKVLIIDAAAFTSKAAAHEYIAEALNFPGYYGKNLDALEDCLSELDPQTSVVMINEDAAHENIGKYACGIIEVFRDTLGERGRFTEV